MDTRTAGEELRLALGVPTRRAPRRHGLAADASLLAIALVIAAGYLAMGAGHVMDDWYALDHARADGAWRAAGQHQIEARPVAALVYALVFGVLDRSIAPTIVVMAAMNAGSAMIIRRLVGLIRPGMSYLVALLWLVFPTVTSIEAWASASNISLALLLALSATWLAAKRGPSSASTVAAFVLAAAAVLAYEAVFVLVVGLVSAFVVLDRQRSTVRCFAALAGASAGVVWAFTHWHPNKRIVPGWGDVGQVIPANLVWGIGPAPVGYVVGLVVLLLSAMAFSSVGPLRALRPFRLPLAIGWGLLLVGVVPFLKYTYAPVGAGDRVNIVSSIGGALLVGTVLHVLFAANLRALVIAVVVLVALSLSPRTILMRSWVLAADDAERIVAEARRVAEPGDVVVLGPARVERNGVTAMQHPDIFQSAVRYTVGRDTKGLLTRSPEEFDEMDGVRIDLRRIIPDPDAPGDL